MGITATLSAPYYTGDPTTGDVPGRAPVALGGHLYLVDEEIKVWEHASVPLLRPQADTSEVIGESSLSPEELLRRSQESWHLGSGQTYLDRPDSDRNRYRASKGVDPWTKWQLSLLPATSTARASANTNLRLAPAGARLYVTDGTEVLFTTDLSSFTACTGHPAAAATSIASNGYSVWTTHVANGVYRTNTGTGAMSQLVTTAVGAAAVVGYVKGRLMVGSGASIYNVTDLTGPAALPTALFTHANTDFLWVGFAEGPSNIYAAGYSGDESLIYRTTIKDDATALDAPIVAGELPDGEIVRSIQGYLGFLLVGSDRGLRLAAMDDAGNLTLGSLIPTGSAVRCMEPQDRFVWYGLTNYDATSTGLGRVDLTQFTAPLTPAYATDLMATAQGDVQSVATFNNQRVFTVSGSGVHRETSDKVATGTLDTGLITYGLPDSKVAVYLDLRHRPLAGTITVSLSLDSSATFNTLGSSSTAGSSKPGSPIAVGQSIAETFEVRALLTRDAVTTTGPTLTRLTLRSYPAPDRGDIIVVPLILSESNTYRGGTFPMDPAAELRFLRALKDARTTTSYQEGGSTYTVFVEDIRWRPTHGTTDHQAWNGLCVVKLKVLL